MNNNSIEEFIHTLIKTDRVKDTLVSRYGINPDDAGAIAEEIYDHLVSNEETFQFIKMLVDDVEPDDESDEFLGFQEVDVSELEF